MLEIFKNKSVRNIQLLCGLLLLGSLYGCGSKDMPTELPKADAVLQLLHAQDASVIQIKLQQCQVGNLFAGQEGTSAKYDIYRCQITVERFDDEYKQSFLKNQVIDLRPYDSETGWQLVASN
ncbi:hypothetical protein DIW83_12935 [Acinetobacter nosocomialis]|uniref:Uncharacterized protein n=1 Tax=Acinetobacter higginsii TaxID=70347 RepID=N9RL39_9GAMM|nr:MULTISPECIES: hypothetical protein [Acinetobacter]AWL19867.1 hypothetical protein DIW83_12935 [Acinetobacter nosocomialis]ENW82232.1 hypothetical protein F909_01309 [Acinetobacter sp. ANC 3929]ENX58698.1 hypothetical protein F902_01322 [Acinetobacter higginsii]